MDLFMSSIACIVESQLCNRSRLEIKGVLESLKGVLESQIPELTAGMCVYTPQKVIYRCKAQSSGLPTGVPEFSSTDSW